jgi:hypothetical protein
MPVRGGIFEKQSAAHRVLFDHASGPAHLGKREQRIGIRLGRKFSNKLRSFSLTSID